MMGSDLKSMAQGWVTPQPHGLKPWRARINGGGAIDRVKSCKTKPEAVTLTARRGRRRAGSLVLLLLSSLPSLSPFLLSFDLAVAQSQDADGFIS